MAYGVIICMFFLLVLVTLWSCVYGKECTNIPTQTSSHTIRSQLRKDSWEGELLSHYQAAVIDKSTYMDLLPRKLLEREASFDWRNLYQSMSSDEISKDLQGGSFLKEASLHDVSLDPDSVQGQAQQTNLEYLLLLEVDRLVWSFRKQAGSETPSKPYGGWEAPDVELRGHFVG